jgi:hypothetical protein
VVQLFAMKGKYSNVVRYSVAKAYREYIRRRIAGIVHWQPQTESQEGCTAIIGMCSRLPSVLAATLQCLEAGKWPSLNAVLVAVDNVPASLPEGFESDTKSRFPELNLQFLYYSPEQSALAESLKLPFIYSWLSWCICLAQVRTRHVLIHDYDALVLGSSLGRRYARFAESQVKVQGIAWYQANGIGPEHRLATTFEAFVDAQWVRTFDPIMLFNKIRFRKGRSVDYDTLLDLQENWLGDEDRDIFPMGLEDLVHPSQMIHQYTMFRKFPGSPLPCFSIIMIPFFSWLGGDAEALRRAVDALKASTKNRVDLIGDGSAFNLSQLTTVAVDWMLKQMLQVVVARGVPPFPDLLEYGSALYEASNTPAELIWVGDFLPDHRQWLSSVRGARAASPPAGYLATS